LFEQPFLGIDFVGRLAKLLIYCSGPFSNNASGGSDDMECECEMQSIEIDLSEGTRDILRFFSFVKPYFNPVSRWSCMYVNNMTSKSKSHNHFQSPASQMLALGLFRLAPSSITCHMNFVIELESWRH
jgi:hypothetical protein